MIKRTFGDGLLPVSEGRHGIRAVLRGGYPLCSWSNAGGGTILVSYREDLPSQAYDLLPDREQQVFHVVGGGHSTVRIAWKPLFSSKTVEKQRSNIRRKRAASDQLSLVNSAVWVGVLDAELWK